MMIMMMVTMKLNDAMRAAPNTATLGLMRKAEMTKPVMEPRRRSLRPQ